jgi:hypothetical protein
MNTKPPIEQAETELDALTIRIRTDIIERFQPGAARKLSEWIEKRLKKPE